jgi:pyruvate dehydrogenase E1 component alpha subunit
MIAKKKILEIYEMMVRIRKFEERAESLFERNLLRGSVHLYIGQEAVAATFGALLTDSDYITSTHRGHGHCLAKGGEAKYMLAELMGKQNGYCSGRGGSMHIADVTKGNLGANAIVAGGIPIATGAALAISLRGSKDVAVCFFGEGAANQGAFHESLNLASVWKLPIVYVCENNTFALTVPLSQSTSVKDISVRSVGYDMPGYTVDGNDALGMYDTALKAIQHAREGRGPSLVECKTYRWKGHWVGDPEVYRSKEEIAVWKKKCPIQRLKKHLLEKGIATPKTLEGIEGRIEEEIDQAEAFARESPEPDPSHVLDNVYCC